MKMSFKLFAIAVVALIVASMPGTAWAQFFVDCSGNTSGAPTTINSVVPQLTNGSSLAVIGTCTENVTLQGLNNISVGAPFNQSMALQGHLTLNGMQNTFVYGVNVTGSKGDGITIQNSNGVQLDACSSSNNAGAGVNISGMSGVNLTASGSYDNNGALGITMSENSLLNTSATAGPIDISGNTGGGIYAERSAVYGFGNLTINNNKANPQSLSPDGFGIQFEGAARGVFLGLFGTNVVSGNQAGGIELQENSEISFCCIFAPATQSNVIQNNGPTGISVGFGSQLTLFDGVLISGHTDAGIDVYGHSQAFISGNNVISGNGTQGSSDPGRAGLRVDGNSEGYLRGGQISQNNGPGILALVNSSLDFQGVQFSGNSDGSVRCDGSSVMASDLPNLPGSGVPCAFANSLANGQHAFVTPHIPDWKALQAYENKYKQTGSAY